jgi:hypothetical protein
MDQLERAVRDGLRVALTTTTERREALVGRLPMTGEELVFRLDEMDSFQVIG